MAFAIRRPTPPPLNGHNFQAFFTPFFLLQLKPTYMKRILHLVSVKNITFKSSYNWFKIDIHQQLRCLKQSNSSYAILQVNTISKQLSDQIFVQKWLINKLLHFWQAALANSAYLDFHFTFTFVFVAKNCLPLINAHNS